MFLLFRPGFGARQKFNTTILETCGSAQHFIVFWTILACFWSHFSTKLSFSLWFKYKIFLWKYGIILLSVLINHVGLNCFYKSFESPLILIHNIHGCAFTINQVLLCLFNFYPCCYILPVFFMIPTLVYEYCLHFVSMKYIWFINNLISWLVFHHYMFILHFVPSLANMYLQCPRDVGPRM